MIGIKKIAPGRMGNRLFHYHFLRQIAQKTGAAYFHKRLPDAQYFEEMEKKPRPFSLFKKICHFTSKDVIRQKPEQFIQTILSNEAAGIDTVFDPPMLGEVFFDYLFFPPKNFIKVKNEFKLDFAFDTAGKQVVGLHFRGTDFKAWNEHASLKYEYYQSAINYCLEYFKNSNLAFVLFTDDLNFETFTKTVSYLKSLKVECYISDNKRAAIYDFYQMSQCDVLVSSPSTFAIFAGCLGKEKKIIHAKSWLDYTAAQQDPFWVQLATSTNPYYRLWRSL